MSKLVLINVYTMSLLTQIFKISDKLQIKNINVYVYYFISSLMIKNKTKT